MQGALDFKLLKNYIFIYNFRRHLFDTADIPAEIPNFRQVHAIFNKIGCPAEAEIRNLFPENLQQFDQVIIFKF